MYTLISKFAIIPPKKEVFKMRKLRLTPTMMEVKTTLAQDCKKFQ